MVPPADSPTTGSARQSQPDDPEPNLLIHESSPYLLQHARNPVRWRPWSSKARQVAAEQDKPIFLSVGYSTCHWCHVMESESFENPQIAQLLNEHFVPVKVDREQRPDLDHIYMLATQMLTGQGGWPNSVWLTPDGRPWFAGTYFPPEDRHGRPGFRTVLVRLAAGWRRQREQIESQADQIAEALRSHCQGPHQAGSALSHMLTQNAVAELSESYDRQFGGFGTRPKFPPHGALRLLIDQYDRGKDAGVLSMVTHTLDQIALGGICDHVGGGFHRYSTDERWFLPHFEKMLYDNAQLIRAFADGYRLTGSKMYRQRVEECCRWLRREMTSPEGGLYAALDADSQGQEGRFYLWSYDELMDVLGPSKGECFAQAYGVGKGGNFRDEATGEKTGLNVLHLNESIEQLAACWEVDGCCLDQHFHEQLRMLRDRRERRPRPARDEKIVTAWNAMAISGLAAAWRSLQDEAMLEMALQAEAYCRQHLRQGQKVLRDKTHGQAGGEGFVEDYALLAQALLDLHEATGQDRFLDDARQLAETLQTRFRDEDGRFWTTTEQHESLLTRTKEPFDNATPSGSAVAVDVLARLAQVTGRPRYMDAARKSLLAVEGFIRRAPAATTTLLLATERYLAARDRHGQARAGQDQIVHAAARADQTTVEQGQRLPIRIRIEMADDWHIASETLALDLDGNRRVSLASVETPTPQRMQMGDRTQDVYSGRVEIGAVLQIGPDAQPGPAQVTVTIGVQPCDSSRCLGPRSLQVPLVLQIAERAGVSHSSDASSHDS